MASRQPTERWSDRVYNENQNAVRAFEVPLDPDSDPINEATAFAKVIQYFGVQAGASHPLEPIMRVPKDGMACDTSRGPHLFKVTASYKWNTPNEDKNPLNRKPTFKWITNSVSEPYDRDLDGNPIVNSVGDVPNPHPTKFVGILGLTVQRWEPSFSIAKWLQYNNAINSDTITIRGETFQPGHLFFESMEQLAEQTLDATAVQIGYRIQCREGKSQVDGIWDANMERFVDRGRRAYFPVTDSSGNTTRQKAHVYTLDEGVTVRVSEDVNLNGRGRVLDSNFVSKAKNQSVTNVVAPVGATVINAPDGSAAYLIYKKKYKIIPFAPLNIFY